MKLVTTGLLVMLLLGINSLNAQHTLSYNLNIGERFKVFQNAKQDITQNMNGSKHEMSNTIEGDYIFEVEGVNDSIITLNFKFERFKMTSTSSLMGELISVNTDDSISEDDVEGRLFSGLTSATLKMNMYKNGKIKSIKGTEQLANNMVNNAGDFDEFTKELMKEAMKKEFGGESLARSFEQLTYIYPLKPVKKDDSWKNKFSGDLSANNVWTLAKISDAFYTIHGESDVSFNTDDESIAMNLTGKMTSEVKTFKDSGFISSITSTSTAEGTSKMKAMNGVEIPTKMTTKITYKVEKYVQ